MKNYFFRSIHKKLLLFVMLFASLNLPSQDMTDPISYLDGMRLGNGFDYYTGKIYSRSPLVNRQPSNEQITGQQVSTSTLFISNYQELESALEINFNSSIDLGIVGGSVKSHFYNKVNFEKNTIYLLVKSSIYNSWDYIDNPILNAEAKNLLNNTNGFDDFSNSYGDSYIYGILSGGSYYGLITIVTTSESEKLEINNKLQAGYVIGSSSLEVKFKEIAAKKGVKITAEEKIIGGSGLGESLGTDPTKILGNMIKKANKLASQVSTYSVPLLAIVEPYTVFPEYLNVGKELTSERKEALLDLSFEYLDYINLKKKLDYFIKNPAFFRFKPYDKDKKINEFTLKIRDIDRIIQKIKDAREFVGDLSKNFPPAYPEKALSFASKIMLPESYQAMVPSLEETRIPAPVELYPLKRRPKGDSEMGGNSPFITITAKLDKKPLKLTNTVDLNVDCEIKENVPHTPTTYQDNIKIVWLKEEVDFTKGLVIKSLSPSFGILKAQGPMHQRQFLPFQSNNKDLILSASCLTDTKGGEDRELGCKDIKFNPVKIIYEHVEDAQKLPVIYKPASDLPIQIFKTRKKSNFTIQKPNKQIIQKPIPK